MRRYILSRSWELAQLPPAALPDLEDPRFTADDPYHRVLDICEGHVADLVREIKAGKPLAPAIADEALVFIDGNHRAVACRIAGVGLPAYVPVEIAGLRPK